MIDEQKIIREISGLMETELDPLHQKLYNAFLRYVKINLKLILTI